MSMSIRGTLACLSLLLATASFAAAPLPAQEARNIISINPLGVVFEVLHGEYERAVSEQASIALASTYWNSSQDFDDSDEAEVSYTSADLKLRFYPNDVLRGFSIGILGGFSSIGGQYRDCDPALPDCDTGEDSVLALSTGVELDWVWRMGRRENFVMAFGFGAKRLFADDDEVDATLAYPFLRFNVGWAF